MSVLKTKNVTTNKTEKLKKELVNPKNLTPLNLLIDSELHTQFKIKTITDRTSMTDVIIEAIRKYVSTSPI